MEEQNKNRLKILLCDVDQEFCRLTPYMQAKLAIEQISMWQQKFNEAKNKVLKENFVEVTRKYNIINQYAEIEN